MADSTLKLSTKFNFEPLTEITSPVNTEYLLVNQGGSSNAKVTLGNFEDNYVNPIIDGRVNKSFVDGLNADADTLDGFHASDSASTAWPYLPAIRADGVMEVGKYLDFHNASGGASDFDVRIQYNDVTDRLEIKGGGLAVDTNDVWHAGNFPFDSTDTPLSGEVLTWNSSKNQWDSQPASGGGGGVDAPYVTSSTGSTNAGNWTKIGTFTITNQYSHTSGFIEIHGGNLGSADTGRGEIFYRVKQQNALGNAPYIELHLDGKLTALKASDLRIVTPTITASETVAELWVRIADSFESFFFTPHTVAQSSNATSVFHTGTGFVASLAAGTDATPQNLDVKEIAINSTGTIGGSTFDNGWLRIGDSTNGLAMDPNEIYFTGTTGHIGTITSHDLNFATGGVTRMTLSAAGVLSVGGNDVWLNNNVIAGTNIDILYEVNTGKPRISVDTSGLALREQRSDGYHWFRRNSSNSAVYITNQSTGDIVRFHSGGGSGADGTQRSRIMNDGTWDGPVRLPIV